MRATHNRMRILRGAEVKPDWISSGVPDVQLSMLSYLPEPVNARPGQL